MRINPAFLYAAVLLLAAGCKSSEQGGGGTTPQNHVKDVVIKDTKVGTGPGVAKGDEVWVLYAGKLANGHMFDTNIKQGGLPFHVTVGAHEVIQGWDEGLIGMKQGGKRTLIIPWEKAYGAKGNSSIPPYSDLTFDIELKTLLKQGDAETISANDEKKGSGPAVKDGDTVTVDYDATSNGESFETQKNVTFKVGGDEVQIPGFDKALIGMQVGGVRDVSVPPALTRMLAMEKLGMNIGVWHVTLKSIKPGSGSK